MAVGMEMVEGRPPHDEAESAGWWYNYYVGEADVTDIVFELAVLEHVTVKGRDVTVRVPNKP